MSSNFADLIFDWALEELKRIDGDKWREVYQYIMNYAIDDDWNLLVYRDGFKLEWKWEEDCPPLPYPINEIATSKEDTFISSYTFIHASPSRGAISWNLGNVMSGSVVEAIHFFGEESSKYHETIKFVEQVHQFAKEHLVSRFDVGKPIPIRKGGH